MPKPKNSKSDAPDTRTRALDAAERLFDEKGVDGTSLQQIADAIGIRAPSLLHHFESKEQLLEEVITRLLMRTRDEAVEAMLSHDAAADRFSAVVEVVRRMAHQHPRLVRVIMSEAMQQNSVALTPIALVMVPMLDKIERSLRGATSLPADAPVRGILLTFLAVTVVRFCLGELGDRLWADDDPAEELLALLLAGLEQRGRSPRAVTPGSKPT
ncbi:MAG: TetR/AcrR family transcriptional regulator [Deltaproteobacteria bacterium]|nr:TetR/AcrR family transcriptional regulator [Deltaproteobacteria bacterium]